MSIEYFVPDDRKAGGSYVTVTGRVRHISVSERTLAMEDGSVIPLDDIAAIAENQKKSEFQADFRILGGNLPIDQF